MSPLHFGIILADQFTLSAFSLFVDYLRLAADQGDGSRQHRVRWSIMSSRGQRIAASCGTFVRTDSTLSTPEAFDYIVVVGGVLRSGPQVDEAILQWLRKAGATAIPIIGICTGSFILCRAGVMGRRTACVSWYHYQDFKEAFPQQPVSADRLFLIDGARITCAGGAGAAALAHHLVEKHLGKAAAQKASQILIFDRQQTRSQMQPHSPLFEGLKDPRLHRCMLVMERNLTRPLAPAAIAAALHISLRQLQRLCQQHLGISLASLYIQLRLHYALWLLENTDYSIMRVALDAGFATNGHFTRRFKLLYGYTPTLHRMQPHRLTSDESTRARVFLRTGS